MIVPLGRPETVSGLRAGGATARVYVRLPVSPADPTAVTVKVEVPAAVGVPVSAPVPPRLNPAGSAPPASVRLNGPAAPDAVIVWPYPTPTRPPGSTAGDNVTRFSTTGSIVTAYAWL